MLIQQVSINTMPEADCSECERKTTVRVWENGSLRPLCLHCVIRVYNQ